MDFVLLRRVLAMFVLKASKVRYKMLIEGSVFFLVSESRGSVQLTECQLLKHGETEFLLECTHVGKLRPTHKSGSAQVSKWVHTLKFLCRDITEDEGSRVAKSLG